MAAHHPAHLRRPALACSQDPLHQVLRTLHRNPRGLSPFYKVTHPRAHLLELAQRIRELGRHL